MAFLGIDSSISSEALTYVFSLFLLWILIRYFADNLPDIFQLLYIISGNNPKYHSVNIRLNDVYYPVSYYSDVGGRPYQEDRFAISKGRGIKDSSLYGVFDGHAGFHCAEYCQDHLLSVLLSDEAFVEQPVIAMNRSFHKVHENFAKFSSTNNFNDGCTANIAMIHGNRIFVGNAGDSRAIVVQTGGYAHVMSIDHKPERLDEQERIRKLGGEVLYYGRWRVQGVLAVSRSIGDCNLNPYVTCEPEILEKKIEEEDEYLVLASDGLWDVMSNEQVAKVVLANASQAFEKIAKYLCNEAVLLGTQDNVTCIVVDLK